MTVFPSWCMWLSNKVCWHPVNRNEVLSENWHPAIYQKVPHPLRLSNAKCYSRQLVHPQLGPWVVEQVKQSQSGSWAVFAQLEQAQFGPCDSTRQFEQTQPGACSLWQFKQPQDSLCPVWQLGQLQFGAWLTFIDEEEEAERAVFDRGAKAIAVLLTPNAAASWVLQVMQNKEATATERIIFQQFTIGRRRRTIVMASNGKKQRFWDALETLWWCQNKI